MELTTKDAFKPRIVPFTVGEYTGFFRIMSGKVRAEFSRIDFKDDTKPSDIFSEFLSRSVCDSQGTLLFGSSAELAEMDAEIISTIFDECWKVNGMGGEAKAEAKKD